MEASVEAGPGAWLASLLVALAVFIAWSSRDWVVEEVLSRLARSIYRLSGILILLMLVLVSIPTAYALAGPLILKIGDGSLVLLLNEIDLNLLRKYALPSGVLGLAYGLAYFVIAVKYLRRAYATVMEKLGDIRGAWSLAANTTHDLLLPNTASAVLILTIFSWFAYAVANSSTIVDGIAVLTVEAGIREIMKQAITGVIATMIVPLINMMVPIMAFAVLLAKIEQERRRRKRQIPWAPHIPT